MTIKEAVLKSAIDDKPKNLPSGVYIGATVLDDLYSLSAHANAVFREKYGMEGAIVLDIHEPLKSSPLRIEGAFTFVANFVATPHDGQEWMHEKLLKLKEPGLRLRFFNDGKVELSTSVRPFDDSNTVVRPLRSETFPASNLNRLESFLASWIKNNLSMRTLIAIEDRINQQADKTGNEMLSPQQVQRLNETIKKQGLRFN